MVRVPGRKLWTALEFHREVYSGGSSYYGENFVSQGQDTFYLKKFNVQGSNLYKHQYMTNVEGAAGEGAKLSRAYTDAMKKEPLVFKIPVFNNMPEAACPKPETTGSPNNKLASLEVEGYSLTPTFNKDTEMLRRDRKSVGGTDLSEGRNHRFQSVCFRHWDHKPAKR